MNDKMTGGKASWITFRNPVGNANSFANPWENPDNAAKQFQPIEDRAGLPIFKREFDVNGLVNAKIKATSLGIFEIFVNGRRVGRKVRGKVVYDELKPGWSDYNKRVLFYTYDLKDYLREGKNIIVAAVAPGWWNGRISCGTYGDNEIAFMAALKIKDANGFRSIYTNKKDWVATWGGRVRAADIWDGEIYDSYLPSFEDLSNPDKENDLVWSAPVKVKHDNILVTPHIGPTIMAREKLTRKPASGTVYAGTVDNGTDFGEIKVKKTVGKFRSLTLKKGQTVVFDMEQNMVGFPTINIKAPKGTNVRLRVGEMLNDTGLKSRGNDGPKGSVYSINYRSARAKAYYIANGDENGEYYCPMFTFFGFRYVEVTATETIEILGFKGVVVGSATEETGKMETSSELVNKLISNVIWGQRGNYLSVPTDCPQRDERLGWTGDTQIFCNTAAYNADVKGFFRKWLQDARDSQSDAGAYPDVIPRMRIVGEGAAAWGDAGIVVPYVMWKMYNDTELLNEHFASMEKYMDFLAGFGYNGPHAVYGDWLAYEPTDARYISVTYYALDAQLMVKMANAIGNTDAARKYDELYKKIRDYYRATYTDENGEIVPDFRTQTGYLLALKTGVLLENQIVPAVKALEKKIIDNGYKLSTGFVGAGILNETLAEAGLNNLAYSLLLQRDNPSWLYSVDQGATTIWERWNSYTLATGFGDVGMNSFNHYAYGSVQEWMYRHVAGIEVDEKAPGFEHIILQPKPDTRTPEEIPAGQELIKWVNCSFKSPTGLIISNWTTENGFKYQASVPVAATLKLPKLTSADSFRINGVSHKISEYKYCDTCNSIIIELAPGNYTFEM